MPASSANLKMSLGRSKAYRPWANRVTRYAPASPSSVLPAAMPSDVTIEPVVVTFTRNAPTMTPGQTRYPNIKVAARAMPVGAQTAVALGFTKASSKPSLPAMR